LIVVDTSFVYALLDRRDTRHATALSWYESTKDTFVTTPLVLAETDYLTRSRGTAQATAAFRRDLAAGVWGVDWWPGAASEAAGIADRYAAVGVSLTDASLVALADRVGTSAVATFDERHFRVLRPAGREPAFIILPADA
jgi:predicted nucleic acid-binding protein